MVKRSVARRITPTTHIVIVDTNILWHEEKSYAVSPDFDQFWASNSELIPLELAVPEIVLGELKFQQVTSAFKKLKLITNELSELSKIASYTHGHRISEEQVKEQVCRKIDDWLSSLGGREIFTPTAEIVWQDLIDAAIWRMPPFTYDPKDKINEKGFRDALILESLLYECRKNSEINKNIVFVCADYLLRETSKQRLKDNGKVLIFETLQDFGSYIQLTQKNLTNQFVKDIQARAMSKFWASNDQNCIFFKNRIAEQIVQKYPDQLRTTVQDAAKGFFSLGNLGLSSWQVTKTNWFIGSTQFRELTGKYQYHWASRVIAARLLVDGLSQPQGLLTPLTTIQPLEDKKIQLVNFDVLWQARVKADGRFHDIAVSDIIHDSSNIEFALEENLKRWNLKPQETPLTTL